MSESTNTHINSLSGKKRKASKDLERNSEINKSMRISDTNCEKAIHSKSQSLKNSANSQKAKYDYNDENKEEDEEESNTKWKTLEHHGVRFPPFYVPHGVPILHKGKSLKLKPAQEEIASFWAQALGTDFTEKETVRKNFEEEFLAVLDEDMGVKSLDDLDFSLIVKHIEEMREKRNSRPNAEKKKEREENARLDTHFRYCIIDGERERVNTVMVEPPGIFRGRGEHPHAGKLKSRILPENVTVNVGPNNVIPK